MCAFPRPTAVAQTREIEEESMAETEVGEPLEASVSGDEYEL